MVNVMILGHHFGAILLTIALAIACVYVVWQMISPPYKCAKKAAKSQAAMATKIIKEIKQ